MSFCSIPEPVSIWKQIWNNIWYSRLNFIQRLYWRWKMRNFGKKFMFPIINRTMPEMSLRDIMSVQPMNEPTEHIYYIPVTYVTKKKKWYDFLLRVI